MTKSQRIAVFAQAFSALSEPHFVNLWEWLSNGLPVWFGSGSDCGLANDEGWPCPALACLRVPETPFVAMSHSEALAAFGHQRGSDDGDPVATMLDAADSDEPDYLDALVLCEHRQELQTAADQVAAERGYELLDLEEG